MIRFFRWRFRGVTLAQMQQNAAEIGYLGHRLLHTGCKRNSLVQMLVVLQSILETQTGPKPVLQNRIFPVRRKSSSPESRLGWTDFVQVVQVVLFLIFFESPHQKSKIIKKSSKIGMNMNMIKNPLTIIMIIHHPILTIHHLQHLATVEAGVRRAKSSSPSTTRKKAVLVSSDSR